MPAFLNFLFPATLQPKKLVCLHACFEFCPSDGLPPFPAHNAPTLRPPGLPPFPYPSYNLNHAFMQSTLSDVETQRG